MRWKAQCRCMKAVRTGFWPAPDEVNLLQRRWGEEMGAPQRKETARRTVSSERRVCVVRYMVRRDGCVVYTDMASIE